VRTDFNATKRQELTVRSCEVACHEPSLTPSSNALLEAQEHCWTRFAVDCFDSKSGRFCSQKSNLLRPQQIFRCLMTGFRADRVAMNFSNSKLVYHNAFFLLFDVCCRTGGDAVRASPPMLTQTPNTNCFVHDNSISCLGTRIWCLSSPPVTQTPNIWCRLDSNFWCRHLIWRIWCRTQIFGVGKYFWQLRKTHVTRGCPSGNHLKCVVPCAQRNGVMSDAACSV
jgi:hypothetical protein